MSKNTTGAFKKFKKVLIGVFTIPLSIAGYKGYLEYKNYVVEREKASTTLWGFETPEQLEKIKEYFICDSSQGAKHVLKTITDNNSFKHLIPFFEKAISSQLAYAFIVAKDPELITTRASEAVYNCLTTMDLSINDNFIDSNPQSPLSFLSLLPREQKNIFNKLTELLSLRSKTQDACDNIEKLKAETKDVVKLTGFIVAQLEPKIYEIEISGYRKILKTSKTIFESKGLFEIYAVSQGKVEMRTKEEVGGFDRQVEVFEEFSSDYPKLMKQISEMENEFQKSFKNDLNQSKQIISDLVDNLRSTDKLTILKQNLNYNPDKKNELSVSEQFTSLLENRGKCSLKIDQSDYL